jgi:multidrug efflux pump subunit AcrB
MNVSSWSIKNPIAAIMVFVLLSFAGVISYNAMKIQNFPDLDLPTVNVVASLPGASPAQLENEVARKIENSMATLQGIKHIYTKVQDGGVTLTAEFRLEKPVQEAVDDVRSAISQVRADLPADLRDPVVSKLNVAGAPVLAYTIRSGRMDAEALSWFVDNTVARQLLSVRGVGAVNRVGGVSREIRIALDPDKLQALNASAADISRQLRQVQMEAAGGKTDLGGSEQPVRTLATVASAQELANLELSLPDGRRLRLDQIGAVSDTFAQPRAAAFLNGVSVVGFEVSRSKGASELEVGQGVTKALADLKLQNPGLEITEAFDFVTPVAEEYEASLTLLIEGGILAVVVVWLFLRDWRATFVSAVALPLSVIPAFIGMHYFGFSINVVTLLALSLVIGILVDDAIVEVENIVRHLRMGKTPYQAAMEAADEIGLAVVATTFTLIAVFLPTAFMSGIAGKFFKQFGWTAAFAVFASLVVARVLTPMMSAYLLKPIVSAQEDSRIMRWYLRAAAWCLKHRMITVIASGLFFIGSIMLIPLLPTGFIPPDDNSQTQIYLELPPGSTLEQTIATAEATRHMLTKVQHVKSVYTTVGGGAAGSDPFAPSGAAESRKATLTILLAERGSRPRKQIIEANIRKILEQLPGVRSRVGLGGSGEKYILVLTGERRSSPTNCGKRRRKGITHDSRSGQRSV